MTDRCLLAVYAHPDDEVFALGGTLALVSERGVRTVLALATGGEEGEVVNPDLRDQVSLADLPEVRQQELECSRQWLGISEVVPLGFRDSGMAGTPANQRPGAFVRQDMDTVVGRIVEIIRGQRPQIICTFEPGGGYGHPDHIMISRATELAFDRAGDPVWYPDAGEVWQPQKLYWPVFAEDMFRRARAALEARGLPFRFGTGVDSIDQGRRIGTPDEEITTVVNILSTLDRKLNALRCYATQMQPDFFFFTSPPEVLQAALSREYFVLARTHGSFPIPEHDLFAGVEPASESG